MIGTHGWWDSEYKERQMAFWKNDERPPADAAETQRNREEGQRFAKARSELKARLEEQAMFDRPGEAEQRDLNFGCRGEQRPRRDESKCNDGDLREGEEPREASMGATVIALVERVGRLEVAVEGLLSSAQERVAGGSPGEGQVPGNNEWLAVEHAGRDVELAKVAIGLVGLVPGSTPLSQAASAFLHRLLTDATPKG